MDSSLLFSIKSVVLLLGRISCRVSNRTVDPTATGDGRESVSDDTSAAVIGDHCGGPPSSQKLTLSDPTIGELGPRFSSNRWRSIVSRIQRNPTDTSM